jgi:hypothetical protein
MSVHVRVHVRRNAKQPRKDMTKKKEQRTRSGHESLAYRQPRNWRNFAGSWTERRKNERLSHPTLCMRESGRLQT